MIKLVTDSSSEITDTTLIYVPSDFAFTVSPLPKNVHGTLLFGMLALQVDLTNNRIVYVSGYAPYVSWKHASLKPPNSRKLALVVIGTQFEPGIARQLANAPAIQGYADIETGWVCLGDSNAHGEAIEFAPSCIAIITDGKLLALWLHPKELPPNWRPSLTN